MPHILVVDDDPHICEVICFALKKAEMQVDVANDGMEALKRFSDINPDLVVLDVGMPEIDGLEVCRKLRMQSDIPILFLSARDEEIDRLLGLEIGGDDYVTKPFSPRELVARINVILRRTRVQNGSLPDMEDSAEEQLQWGKLILDPARHMATYCEESINLTAVEFSILKTLMSRPGIVFSRDKIMHAAYDARIHVSNRTIDSHIRNLRSKFVKAGCGNLIETVHGVGFKLGDCSF